MIAVQVIGLDKAVKDLNSLAVKLPQEMSAAVEEFGKSLQRRMKLEITARRLIWTRRLHDRTQWRQTGNSGHLFMPYYGIDLDREKPHWEILKRGRKITRWAAEKGIKGGAVYVRPKHFIQGPVDRTIADLSKILKRHLDKAMA